MKIGIIPLLSTSSTPPGPLGRCRRGTGSPWRPFERQDDEEVSAWGKKIWMPKKSYRKSIEILRMEEKSGLMATLFGNTLRLWVWDFVSIFCLLVATFRMVFSAFRRRPLISDGLWNFFELTPLIAHCVCSILEVTSLILGLTRLIWHGVCSILKATPLISDGVCMELTSLMSS